MDVAQKKSQNHKKLKMLVNPAPSEFTIEGQNPTSILRKHEF